MVCEAVGTVRCPFVCYMSLCPLSRLYSEMSSCPYVPGTVRTVRCPSVCHMSLCPLSRSYSEMSSCPYVPGTVRTVRCPHVPMSPGPIVQRDVLISLCPLLEAVCYTGCLFECHMSLCPLSRLHSEIPSCPYVSSLLQGIYGYLTV